MRLEHSDWDVESAVRSSLLLRLTIIELLEEKSSQTPRRDTS
jgi:hypothetical protein